MTSGTPARGPSTTAGTPSRRPVLAVADGEAEDLPTPVTAPPGGDHDRLGDDPAVDLALPEVASTNP